MVPVCAALALLFVGTSALEALPLPVKAGEAANYARGFSAIQASTRTFQADVRQTLQLEGVAKPILSFATLFYSAPRQMLLRFTQPAGEWMLIQGTQLAVKKQGRPLQVSDLSAPGKAPSHAASLLDFFHSDASHWNKDFQVTMFRDGSSLIVHLKPYLTPTAPAQGVEEIVTTLELPGYLLAGIELHINAANRMTYEFSHVQRNVALDPALFHLPATP